MPPPSIRPAGPADLAGLLALEQLAFSGDRLSARQYRRHLASPRAAVLAATDAHGTLLGSAVVFFRRNSRTARLYSIASDPQARGRGIGRALLAAAADCARRRGCVALRLEVRVDNGAAIALYEREGFRPIGRYRGYYEDGADALRYERPLPGPPRGGA